ncbi:DNA polymerase III, delta subunit [Gracilibacillus ureilyticus]|uniref:DNA polymerase III subunit delta n=1 Tax=Gracilibacillus ureilyticus TaxID=531814 RepID=A0A1H9M3T9_9BACI|nr:DNA polymerase III subunit delta [Gracilibacillus ureilyticus]SER18380.1 DNA polymerase III, delta subunit [Gracilibacillus ureilyticus]
MDYLQTIEQIKKGKISPVYYIYGTEIYMIEEIKQSLYHNSMSEADRDTNVSIFDLEEVPIQEVVNDANTYPFFGEKKLIVAGNASFLKAKPPATDLDHQPDVLTDYLINPAPYSILVIIAPFEKLDERKKVVKQLKKHATTIACEPLKEWNMNEALERIADNHHVKVEPDVVTYMINEIGTDLMILQSELEKMALYIGEGNTIRMEEAELLLSHHESNSALKLVDAIIANDLVKAINIMKDLEKLGEEPIKLIALLASQFRTLLHIKTLHQKGYNQKQMASQLKIHPYVAKLSVTRQAKFTKDELTKAIELLAEADANMKTGKVEKTLGIELLLYQLIMLRKKNITA